MAAPSARLGLSIAAVSLLRVSGEVAFLCSHSSMARFSYVLPSGSTTGSRIVSPVIGQRKLGGQLSAIAIWRRLTKLTGVQVCRDRKSVV